MLALILLCIVVWALEVYSPEKFGLLTIATRGGGLDSARGFYIGAIVIFFIAFWLYTNLAALVASVRMNGLPLTLFIWALMVIPGVGLVMVLFLYLQAKYQLKTNGVRLGLFGVDRRSYPPVTGENEHLPAGMSDAAALLIFFLISIAGSLTLVGVAGVFFFTSLPNLVETFIPQGHGSSGDKEVLKAELEDDGDGFVEPPWDTMESVEEYTEIDDDVLPEIVPDEPEAPKVLIAMRDWTNRNGVVMRAELRSVALDAEGKYEGMFIREDGNTFQYRIARLSGPNIDLVKAAIAMQTRSGDAAVEESR
ncbi:MAG: hypothetical protein KDN22_20330 [Verrucomicrobiae bacterium]|nr:hypothetical protein [Verrucomicrobiae bacterium]